MNPAAALPEPELRGKRAWAGVLWLVASAVLLTGGFLGYVYVASLVAVERVEPDAARQAQVALVIYAQIVLAKGLLPQLLVAFALWPVIARVISLRGRLRLTVVAIVAAAAACAIVIPTLLTSEAFDLPAVKFTGPWNVARTALEMTVAVAAALLLPRSIRR